MSLSEHEEKRMYIQLVLVSKLRRLLLAPAENKLNPIEQAFLCVLRCARSAKGIGTESLAFNSWSATSAQKRQCPETLGARNEAFP